MIRLLFALFLTLSGFVAAALWTLSGGNAQRMVEEILPAEVRTFDLESVTPLLPAAPPRAADVAAEVSVDVAAPVAAESPIAAPVEEPVEVRELAARSDFLAEDGAGMEPDADAGQRDGDASLTSPPPVAAVFASGDAARTGELDQDEWAFLIRRMLSVYRRTGALE